MNAKHTGRGLFITFEGGEGAGKSTQIARARDFLAEKGLDAMCLREPGGTRISERIRELLLDPECTEMTPETETLLYAASRAQLAREVIMPALDNGITVLCDRFLDSSVVYQGYCRGIGEKGVIDANALAVDGLVPDVTFLLDVPPNIGFSRKSEDKPDRVESVGESFHILVRESFLKHAKANQNRFVIIDATKDQNNVYNAIKDVLTRLVFNTLTHTLTHESDLT